MFKQELGEGENFDVIVREIRTTGRKAALVCIDGFVKDDILTEIMETLALLKKETFGFSTLKTMLGKGLPYIELATENKVDELLYAVMSGSILLIVDGSPEVFIIDARTYPARSPEEPDIERVVRGSRDGFTETIVFNTALVRRRIRDPKLRIKLLQVGKRSKTDVCLVYIKDIADPGLVETIEKRINSIDIDAVPMAEKSIEELIMPGAWWNPFPRVRYTERPDVAAVHLVEGHVLVMVDTSPSVMITPATYFHHVQHAEEYRQNPAVGVYIRWVRFLAILGSIIITPLWLLFALSPELLPPELKFIGPKEVGQIPLLLQFVIGELALDLMRMAAIHTPSPLATALGVIAALLIGDVAVRIGLLIPEVILYTAVVAIGSFSTPSYEMAMANRLVRFFLLLATGFFRLPGLIVALIIVLLVAGFTRSYHVPYLWPLVPFNYEAFKSILIRSPVPVQNIRPQILNPQDDVRQPSPAFKRRRS
ncbi:spore germination protein [Syntrophomonas erecta]